MYPYSAHLSQTPSSCIFRYYSATILQMAGIRDDKQAIWLTAATSGTNFVFTLVGVWLVERVGRRKLTLGSLFGTLLERRYGRLAWFAEAECEAERASKTWHEGCVTIATHYSDATRNIWDFKGVKTVHTDTKIKSLVWLN